MRPPPKPGTPARKRWRQKRDDELRALGNAMRKRSRKEFAGVVPAEDARMRLKKSDTRPKQKGT
jgi:hypothetical protein